MRENGYESPWSVASVLERWFVRCTYPGFQNFTPKIWSNGEHVTRRTICYLTNSCFGNNVCDVVVMSIVAWAQLSSANVVRFEKNMNDTHLTLLTLVLLHLFVNILYCHSGFLLR